MKTFSDRYYFNIGSEETLYGSDVFYSYPTVVFYQGSEKSFGAFLYEYDPLQTNPFRTEVSVIEEGSFLFGYHQGPYEVIAATSCKMRSEAKDLKLADKNINFNILDQFVERNNQKFITEIQIPILEV